MKNKIRRELAHVGMFGTDGTIVTRQQLAECKEVFDGKCPVVLGHKLADWMPSFGNVSSVELAQGGDSLVGDIEEHDLLKEAREAGFYSDLSVGIKKRAVDGKHYLHHTAYLGAVPPKIRDLEIFADVGVVYCADAQGMMTEYSRAAPSAEERNLAMSRIAQARQRGWSIDEAKAGLDKLSAWAAEMALTGSIPEELLASVQQLADQASKSPSKEDEVDEKLKKENERLSQELADSNAARLKTAKAGLTKSMEGRVPKGKQNLVLALADAVASNESIELSDEDGKKESVSGLEILRRVLEVIPKPVTPGSADLGDQAEDGKPVDMTRLMSRV